MVEVYLVYGFSFVLLGVAALLRPSDAEGLPISRHFWLLGCFGLLHGGKEFFDAWLLATNSRSENLAWAGSVILTLSFLFLFEFGRRAVTDIGREGNPLCRFLGSAWFYIPSASMVVLIGTSSGVPEGLAAGSRLFLCFPSAVAVGLILRRAFPAPSKAGLGLGLSFACYGVFGGLVAEAVAVFPAWLPTQAEFFDVTGLPIQIFRAACAVTAMVSLTILVRGAARRTLAEARAHADKARGLAESLEQRVEARTAALMQSERDLKEAQRIARIGSWELDIVKNVLRWSDEIYRMFEIDSKTFGATYEAFLEAVHPNDRDILDKAYNRSLIDHKPYDFTHRLLMPDGRIKWVHERGETDYGADGTPLLSRGTVQDITELTLANEALAVSEARLQEAHRLARLADWHFDIKTQNITIYGAILAEIGFAESRLEVPLNKAIEVIYHEDAERTQEAFQRSIAEGTRFESTHRVQIVDGRLIDVQLIGEVLHDKSGITSGMRGTIQDVSAAKEADRELKNAKDKLADAQRIAGIGSYDFDSAKGEVTGSEEFFRIFDLAAEENAAIPTAKYYDFVHPDDRARLRTAILKAKKPGESFNLEYRIISAKGVEKFVLGFGRPLFGEEGKFLGFTGTLQDVTAVKRAERQLRQAQKMEAVGQLTGGIAHDFNNLLAIIMGNLDLARMRAHSDPQLVKMLEVGLSASERGAELTKQLLAYSRRQTLLPQPTDTNDITNQMLRLARRTLGETIDVKFEPAEDAWWVRIDPAQLESALLNLAINSRDAMPNGGTLTIRTRNLTVGEPPEGALNSLSAGDYVEIEVSDTGTGMTENVRQKAFEPFFTTKEVGQGSGMGLSMVYGFAKQSGGRVKIRSTPGEGTSIYLYLPRAKREIRERSGPRSEAIESGSHDETVLIVEDDPHVRDLAISLVESLGYFVMQAGDPRTALGIFENDTHIDLLLSDVILGKDMNGVELANRVRENYPGVQILLMSGNARDALEKSGEEGDDYTLIDKPFSRATLAEKIDALLH